MKHVIVVCGTYYEWMDFRNWFKSNNKITEFKIHGNSFTVTNLITYHCMIANDYSKIMGFSKYTTDIVRIGTWYRNITEDAEKYLMLFEVGK